MTEEKSNSVSEVLNIKSPSTFYRDQPIVQSNGKSMVNLKVDEEAFLSQIENSYSDTCDNTTSSAVINNCTLEQSYFREYNNAVIPEGSAIRHNSDTCSYSLNNRHVFFFFLYAFVFKRIIIYFKEYV